MIDLENTLTTKLFIHAGAPARILGVTILWHPDSSRIGEQHLGPAAAGALEIGRYAPLFFRPGQDGTALGHRAIARAPLTVVRDGADAVAISAPDSRMAVELNGRLLDGSAQFSSDEVARGVVLGLGGHVLLCLHWMLSLPKPNNVPGMLGVSSAAIATRELIRQVAATDLPVLLLGETGTGKDLGARAIHLLGRRKDKPWVPVNMATLNEALAAADLFGAVKGAYTGAQAARPGLFAEADGGTLFLDEIGDTPATVQPMLLRVLESGAYRPLGASQDATSTARLIAATDQDLAARGFNQALTRRMEAFVIRVPSLRERREDIGLLLQHFLRQYGCDDAQLAAFPVALVDEICNYDWPGNVRQLANVVRRALMALRAGQQPTLGQFVDAMPPALGTERSTATKAEPQPQPAHAPRVRRKLDELTGDDVLAAMEDNGWQISAAAQQLAISRPSLYKLIEAHPAIRPAALIPAEEIAAALRAAGGDLSSCASQLKTPSEALRRHLRVLGLDAGAPQTA